MERTFVMPVEIGFRHCDPAGIVFYPRYVEILNDTVEYWFKHGLGEPFAVLHGVHRTGVPIVNLQCEFSAPSRLSESLAARLSVLKLGRTSMTLDIALHGTDDAATLRMRGRLVLVFTDLDAMASVEIPARLRAAIEAFLD